MAGKKVVGVFSLEFEGVYVPGVTGRDVSKKKGLIGWHTY